MNRRELLRAVGAATVLSFIPRDAEAVWERLASGRRRVVRAFDAKQTELVAVIAEAIIPGTDSPGATDVGVPEWIDLVVAEYYDDTQRRAFLAGLQAIDESVRSTRGVGFTELDVDARDRVMTRLDQPDDRDAPEARAFARLKGLVIHGYFTSERVHREVLRVQTIPGRYDGNVYVPQASGS